MKPTFAEKVATRFVVDDDRPADACAEKHLAMKRKALRPLGALSTFIVGLNLYESLTIAVMVSIVISIMLVIVIVPIAIRVPAIALDIPPAVRMLPAVMPRVA
jgi:hypothetical protein